MFRFFVAFALFFALWGCSVSKNQFIYEEGSADSGEVEGTTNPSKSPLKKKVSVDYTQPATFEEYREWRKANDPSGQTYAEYKEWEATYRQWIEDQSKAIR